MILILLVINSYDEGLHISINGNQKRRIKTKLETRGGKMKSTDKNKGGTVTKRRKEWIPPGVGSAYGAGRAT